MFFHEVFSIYLTVLFRDFNNPYEGQNSKNSNLILDFLGEICLIGPELYD